MFHFEIAGITPRDIENHNKTFNFNITKLFTGNSSGGGGDTPVNGRFVTSLDMPSGGCWWDTEYICNQDTEIRSTFMRTSNYIKYVYGDSTKNVRATSSSSGAFHFGGVSVSFPIEIDTKYTIIQNKSGVTCNGEFKAYTNVPNFTSANNLIIGAMRAGDSVLFEGRLFDSFQIYQAGQLVLDWRAFVDADGKPCFYDTVSKTNKYNLGTGTLTYTE